MSRIMLLLFFVSQFTFAQNKNPSPSISPIVAVPTVMLMSTALRARNILKEIWGGFEYELMKVDVAAVPNSQLRFDITIYHQHSKTGEKKSKTICAALEFTSGPGPSPDGKGAAVAVPGPHGDQADMSDGLWMFVNYQPDACPKN